MKILRRNNAPAEAKELSRSQSHVLVEFQDGLKYHVPKLFWDSKQGQFFDQGFNLHLAWR